MTHINYYRVFPSLFVALITLCISVSCRNANWNNRSDAAQNDQEEPKAELVGWDYLSKISVRAPGGGGFSGHSCDAKLYVKYVGETIFYKIIVFDTENPYRNQNIDPPKEEEFLVERNPKYQSVDIGDLHVRGYKYKAGEYYFNMDY